MNASLPTSMHRELPARRGTVRTRLCLACTAGLLAACAGLGQPRASDACRSGGTTRWLLSDGTVHGRVVEGKGRPAAGIHIDVRPLAGGERIRALSNAEGEFRVPDLPPGHHEVRFARIGLELWTARVVVAEHAGEHPVVRLCAAALHLHDR